MNLVWSKEELETLKKVYPAFIQNKITQEELTSIFLNRRTFKALRQKADEIGISKSEIARINKNLLEKLISQKRVSI